MFIVCIFKLIQIIISGRIKRTYFGDIIEAFKKVYRRVKKYEEKMI
tara:strand:- start:50 stop:187 length:138 start_codon:yes stop_codon:yes gene_type:complete